MALKNLTIFLFLLLATNLAAGQPTAVSALNKQPIAIKSIVVLKDRGYSLQTVLADKSLRFAAQDSLKKGGVYWLKAVIINKDAVGAVFQLSILPDLDNTLFHYDRAAQRWTEHYAAVYKTPPTALGIHDILILPHNADTIYAKINLRSPVALRLFFRPVVTITPKSALDNITQNRYMGWLAGMVMLFFYVFNNAYLYISFRDKSILYYLIAQVGSMIYLTSYWRLFDSHLANALIAYVLGNRVYYYSFDKLATHVGILVVFYGFSNLNRSYLNSKVTLPAWDRCIRFCYFAYASVTMVKTFLNFFVYDVEYYTLPFDNLFCLLFILLIIGMNVAAYKSKRPSSGAFLLANVMPLSLAIAVPIFHLIIEDAHNIDYWLIILAIVAQAFSLSIALVAHIRNVRVELNNAEYQSQQLQFNLLEAEYMNKLNEQELLSVNANMRSEQYRNQLLQERLDTRQRELATSALYMVQKNELLNYIKTQIQDLKRTDRYNTRKILNDTLQMLENNDKLDIEWDGFKAHFEKVHPDFFEQLKVKHPNLTQKEVRLYAYFEMKLSHKEIGALLGIDPASVRRAKTRLIKKMALSDHDSDI